MTCRNNNSAFVRAANIVILALSFALGPAFADDEVVTYVENEGRFIELTDSLFPGETSIKGAQMAIEDDAISTRANMDRPISPALAIHAWTRDGDDFLVHFIRAGYIKRYHSNEVKTIVVDRNPTTVNVESFSQPDPV